MANIANIPLPIPGFESVQQARAALQQSYGSLSAVLKDLSFETTQNNKMFWTADFSATATFPTPNVGNFKVARQLFVKHAPRNGVVRQITIRGVAGAQQLLWSVRFGVSAPTKLSKMIAKVSSTLTQCLSLPPTMEKTLKTTTLRKELSSLKTQEKEKDNARRFYLLRRKVKNTKVTSVVAPPQKRNSPVTSKETRTISKDMTKNQQSSAGKETYAQKVASKSSTAYNAVPPQYDDWDVKTLVPKLHRHGLSVLIALRIISQCKTKTTTGTLVWARHILGQTDCSFTARQIPQVYKMLLERHGLDDLAVSSLSSARMTIPGVELRGIYDVETSSAFHSLCTH